MVKRFAVTGGAILAAIVLGAALAVVPRIDSLAAPPQHLVEKEEQPPESPPSSQEASSPSAGYLLGAYNGRVSVLSPDTREPEMIFDIFLRTLPEPDQQLLREGIRVETYEELTRLIEDYIS